jgi:hypothetical protein
MTERENFLKVMHGETPEWVPRYTFGPDPYATKPLQCTGIMSSANGGSMINKGKGRIDVFGVEYVATEETGWQMLPVPGKFILDDVRYWRNVVRLPDLSGIDWDYMCKKDAERSRIDYNVSAVTYGVGGGFFLPLMNLMGFTNGLIAMYEEPEAVKEMYDYMCNWYLEILDHTFDRFKFDIFSVGDDTATAQNPFISPECYRDLIKPFMLKITKKAVDRGMPIMMHCCGRCEDLIDDWVDFGVNSWNPAQVMNDLGGIKKKYGNNMVLMGCWDSSGPAGYAGASEELVRQTVRDTIDRHSAGGGFIFLGSTYGPDGDVELANRRRWMTSEYEAYREHPYKK